MNVVVVTDIPSPYQVELFNAIANGNGWDIVAVYVRRSAKERNWAPCEILHEHRFLSDANFSHTESLIANAAVAIFSGYRPAQVSRLISIRNRAEKAWAFWGERPGYRFPGRFGRVYRAWALRELRSCGAPIWGIGQWAIDGYRSELGERHLFFNVPYCSNLAPFFAIGRRRLEREKACRFLFSGSFIARKGVDLVVSAFGQLLHEGHNVELHLVGGGPMERALKASSLSFSSKVYIHGFKQSCDLPKTYAEADILVAPSRYDGWGLVVSEGLAAGMPVISTFNTGSARELIDQRNGWMVRAGDEKDLLSAMRSAATLEMRPRMRMSHHAREVARSQDIGPGVKRFVQATEMTLAAWANGDI